MASLTGIVLAAGAGTRMGSPKALVLGADGVPWVARAANLLLDAGCERVVVVLGAAPVASSLLPDDPRISVVVAERWAEGMSASLRAGLAAASASASADAVLITLVDLPALPVEVVLRVVAGTAGLKQAGLQQAVYSGRPGHPVFVAREHWAALSASLDGDSGARDYLRANGVEEIECGDLWNGLDVDSR